MVAAENGHDNCVVQLMKAGAEVNTTDDLGNTDVGAMADMWASMADKANKWK